MMHLVIGVLLVLIVAVVAAFAVLLVVNVALFVALRHGIRQETDPNPGP
jgi:hypothetical protein